MFFYHFSIDLNLSNGFVNYFCELFTFVRHFYWTKSKCSGVAGGWATWPHSPYTILILKPKRVNQLPSNVRAAERLVILKRQTQMPQVMCQRTCFAWTKTAQPQKHVSAVKRQKKAHQFLCRTMVCPFRISFFFFFILLKEQLRKRQQVDFLLGQMRMEGKERKIIDWQGSDALEGLGVLIGAWVQNEWNFCMALRPGGFF